MAALSYITRVTVATEHILYFFYMERYTRSLIHQIPVSFWQQIQNLTTRQVNVIKFACCLDKDIIRWVQMALTMPQKQTVR